MNPSCTTHEGMGEDGTTTEQDSGSQFPWLQKEGQFTANRSDTKQTTHTSAFSNLFCMYNKASKSVQDKQKSFI